MRQAELQQLEVFREMAGHFNIDLKFPDLGDRVALQASFATNPFLVALKAFFAGRITAEECGEKILALQEESPRRNAVGGAPVDRGFHRLTGFASRGPKKITGQMGGGIRPVGEKEKMVYEL